MIKLLTVLLLVMINTGCRDSKKENNSQNALQQVPSPANTASAQPNLFTDANGLVYLSWIQRQKDKSELKFSILNNGHWSEPGTITSGNDWFVNWADFPMLAANGDNLLAHILQKSAGGTFTYDVKLVTSADDGKTWSDLKNLHSDGKKAEHGFVSLLPYGDQFFVSWLDGRNTVNESSNTAAHHSGEHGGAMTLRGAVVTPQGIKTAEWELDNKVCDCCQTTAALTANGPVVVYRDRSNEEIRDMSIVRFVDGTWTAPQIIHPDGWKIGGCPVNGPRSAAIGNVLAIAWFTSANELPQVNLIFSEDGGATFGKLIRIAEKNTIGRVDVVMLDDKTALVSWMEGSVIKAAKVHRDGIKEQPVTIGASSESRSSGFPQMTKSGNNIFFAWTDDKEKTIKVARLTL